METANMRYGSGGSSGLFSRLLLRVFQVRRSELLRIIGSALQGASARLHLPRRKPAPSQEHLYQACRQLHREWNDGSWIYISMIISIPPVRFVSVGEVKLSRHPCCLAAFDQMSEPQPVQAGECPVRSGAAIHRKVAASSLVESLPASILIEAFFSDSVAGRCLSQ